MSFDLKFYFRIFLIRLPLFLAVFIPAVAIGLAIASSLPKKYRAQAFLLVESSQIPSDLAASTVRTELSDQVQVIQQKLMTRDNLLDLAYRFDLFSDEPDLQPEEIIARMRDRVWMRLTMGRQQATIFTITAEAKNGETAAGIVNALVDQVLEQDAAFRTEVASDTLLFFEKEVRRLGDALDAANTRILDFQNKNVDALPETLDFRMGRQSLLQERMTQIRREIGQLNDQRRRLSELFQTTGRTEAQPRRALSPEEEELEQLNAQLREALSVYSDTHPRVAMLRSRIGTLEAVLEARNPDAEPETPGERVFNAQIVEIDSQLEALHDTISDLEPEIASLQATIERTPTNAITLSAMERDRANIQSQYDTAVSRLSAAATGERIEVLSKGQRLSVIERAVPPARPSEPKMILMGAGAVGLGLVLGIVAVVLREILNPKIRRPAEISKKLGITPLGTIPFVDTPGERWRQRGLRSAALVVVIAGIVGALIFIDRQVSPLDQIAQKVLRQGRL
ncbi:GumC family protein [Pseudooceanicola nanhaiensis]|uniref:GumC family protein n=2 Tax=Pseudooceanicola nanhaiensis TaxID=375761 RepID=UPI004058215E